MAEYKEEIRCPRCNSLSINIEKKGFGVGKALAGAVITGGVGLLAGFIGSDKIKATCLACGNTFKPQDGYIKIRIEDPEDTKRLEERRLKEWDKANKQEAIAKMSDEDLEKKFKMWDNLQLKGLLTKEELEKKKKDYLEKRK